MKVFKLKAMGFLCGAGIFLAAAALAGGEVVIEQWAIEKLLIPLVLMIVAACGWYVRSVDRRLEELAKSMSAIAGRISHIEGKLDISQTGGHQR